MDLVYDLDGNFLYRNLEMPSEDLPITVLAVVNQAYPGFVINEQVNLQDWGENIKYEMTLGSRSASIDIIITEEGNIIFESEH